MRTKIEMHRNRLLMTTSLRSPQGTRIMKSAWVRGYTNKFPKWMAPINFGFGQPRVMSKRKK